MCFGINKWLIPTSVLYSYQMSEKLENIFSLLVTEYFSSSESRDNSINLLGILFLINAHEYVKHRSSSSTLPHYEALDKLRSQILNSPQNQYKISELAQSIHMSPSYFQNCYKKAFGTSCINDIINARIKKATYLLTSTDKTEAEIAELCGYNSNEHFIRQFKSYKGKTPSQFRKTIKL